MKSSHSKIKHNRADLCTGTDGFQIKNETELVFCLPLEPGHFQRPLRAQGAMEAQPGLRLSAGTEGGCASAAELAARGETTSVHAETVSTQLTSRKAKHCVCYSTCMKSWSFT